LPTPGPLAAGAVVAVVALELELLAELLDDEVLLLPQADRPTTSAITAQAPPIDALALLHLVPLIRRLLLVVVVS
jgi:hypothetical protein